MVLKNVVPQLPNGIRVGEKPSDLEIACIRNADRWKPIIETLKVIDSMKTIQIEMSGMGNGKIQSMKTSLKKFAQKVGFKPKIKFALKDNILHIWSNK